MAALELADVFRRFAPSYLAAYGAAMPPSHLRVIEDVLVCHTKVMGGHVYHCQDCGERFYVLHGCGNRACPSCHYARTVKWLEARREQMLPCPYYHVVFTLPGGLNKICLHSSKIIYKLLFKTAWAVISGFAANPKFLGANTGMVAILHTWGQNLSLHPHLHCIVPGGGITASGKWQASRGKNKYLFPVKAMSKVFQAKFVQGLRKQIKLDNDFYKQLFAAGWVVYCKQPFFGPSQVVEYLGRYTHKIAISNHRILSIENNSVTFSAKDYRHGGKTHPVTLTDNEFIRRFAMHILPKGFTRIRHYGILSSSIKNKVIPSLQKQLGLPKLREKQPIVHRPCPKCKTGQLTTIFTFNGRAPPVFILEKLSQNIVPLELTL